MVTTVSGTKLKVRELVKTLHEEFDMDDDIKIDIVLRRIK